MKAIENHKRQTNSWNDPPSQKSIKSKLNFLSHPVKMKLYFRLVMLNSLLVYYQLWVINVSKIHKVIFAKSKNVISCLPGLAICWLLVAQILLPVSAMIIPIHNNLKFVTVQQFKQGLMKKDPALKKGGILISDCLHISVSSKSCCKMIKDLKNVM